MESLYNDQKSRSVKRFKPRRMRSAIRAGWHVVEVDNDTRQNNVVSHLGLMIWIDANKVGNYINSYNGHLSKFAFERIEDAAFFKLKWS